MFNRMHMFASRHLPRVIGVASAVPVLAFTFARPTNTAHAAETSSEKQTKMVRELEGPCGVEFALFLDCVKTGASTDCFEEGKAFSKCLLEHPEWDSSYHRSIGIFNRIERAEESLETLTGVPPRRLWSDMDHNAAAMPAPSSKQPKETAPLDDKTPPTTADDHAWDPTSQVDEFERDMKLFGPEKALVDSMCPACELELRGPCAQPFLMWHWCIHTRRDYPNSCQQLAIDCTKCAVANPDWDSTFSQVWRQTAEMLDQLESEEQSAQKK
eukprot:GABV01001368.1.p1 GENE.GABV01001368.1~~GABV01001368.1.p1  ORF type:complete len:270 (-),score=87.65 GABV01001368.1:12-821(-)